MGSFKRKERQLEIEGVSYICENNCRNEVDYSVLEHHKLLLCHDCFVRWSKNKYYKGETEEVSS